MRIMHSDGNTSNTNCGSGNFTHIRHILDSAFFLIIIFLFGYQEAKHGVK